MAAKRKDEEEEDWELVSHDTFRSTLASTFKVVLTDSICTAFLFALFWVGTPIWAHGLALCWFVLVNTIYLGGGQPTSFDGFTGNSFGPSFGGPPISRPPFGSSFGASPPFNTFDGPPPPPFSRFGGMPPPMPFQRPGNPTLMLQGAVQGALQGALMGAMAGF